MVEQRLPPSVKDDDDDVIRQGEVVITRAWRTDLQLNADAAFTIVLAEEPLTGGASLPSDAPVVVCAPMTPVRVPAAVAALPRSDSS